MGDLPNARAVDRAGKVTEYCRVGDTLKLRYYARRKEGTKWLEFSPSCLHVELNGEEIQCCEAISIEIKDGVPRAKLSISLQDLDIDMDTLVALKAIVEARDRRLAEKVV